MTDDLPHERVREMEARSLLGNLHRPADPWFLGRYGMNLYRGCGHGCRYCDGRAERYCVEGDFARDIAVKVNAPELLARELQRVREPGFVLLGGGVCDAYQAAEARYGLARKALSLILAHGLPVHVLTKSSLVARDFDLLAAIHSRSRAILSFSIGLLDEELRGRYEPGACTIAERFSLLEKAKLLGLGTAVMAMPVLPGLSDQPQAIGELVERAAGAGVDFVCYGGLTLRPGRQKEAYFQSLTEHRPDLLPGYARVFGNDAPSGMGDPRYYERVDGRFREALARVGLPARAPARLFRGVVPRYTEVALRLEHRGQEQADRLRAGQAAAACYALQEWTLAKWKADRRRSLDVAAVEQRFEQALSSRDFGDRRLSEAVLDAAEALWRSQD